MRLFIFLTIFSVSILAQAQTELPEGVPRIRWTPNPTFVEEGFRLGYILRLQENIFWHFEGQFMMGFGSSPQVMKDRECEAAFTQTLNRQTNARARQIQQEQMAERCTIEENPWLFSVVDRSLYNQFQTLGAVPVVVYYTRSTGSFFGVFQTGSLRALMTNTLNYVQQIIPVNPQSHAPTFFHIDRGELPVALTINPAEGFVEGRVVKASLDHFIRKTYEITFQKGKFGNNFLRLSVNSREMFDHLILSMLTGELVRVGYVRLFNIQNWFASLMFAYTTNYRVTSVEILRSGEAPLPPSETNQE